jgi:hypothetical protein
MIDKIIYFRVQSGQSGSSRSCHGLAKAGRSDPVWRKGNTWIDPDRR